MAEPSAPVAGKPDIVLPAPSAAPSASVPEARRDPSPSGEVRTTAPRSDLQQGEERRRASGVALDRRTGPPVPQPASPPPPVVATLDGLWTFTERVHEDVHAIECAASGALQLKAGDGVLGGTLKLKQDCKEGNTTESTEATAALTAGTIVGDVVSFVTRSVNDKMATTCHYSGRVVGSSRGTMRGEVTCEAREAGVSSVLSLRGTWGADRTSP